MPPSTVSTPLGKVVAIPFPGRVIKAGDPDREIVSSIQTRLNEVGCGPLEVTGIFDAEGTKRAVKLFQSRFTDVSGRPLVIDGEVGSFTWGAMFGSKSIPSTSTAPSSLVKGAIEFAATQVGIRERPLGSNRGPEVDRYLRAVGLNPANGSFAWCVAFTHFCYQAAAESLGVANPHIKTAGVLDHWNRAGRKPGVLRVTRAEAVANPGLVKPGSLFVIDLGSALGHSGMVVESSGGRLLTIEGNTNDGGSRNGIGVFERDARKINQINKGFIDYSGF
ncbi:MAG TPA: peptidoglycan-binding protein [Pyrinomonadaceae bacterium]|nr:peptidoglycan-binding protein [Pyrinomonadaceae bacterium]